MGCLRPSQNIFHSHRLTLELFPYFPRFRQHFRGRPLSTQTGFNQEKGVFLLAAPVLYRRRHQRGMNIVWYVSDQNRIHLAK